MCSSDLLLAYANTLTFMRTFAFIFSFLRMTILPVFLCSTHQSHCEITIYYCFFMISLSTPHNLITTFEITFGILYFYRLHTSLPLRSTFHTLYSIGYLFPGLANFTPLHMQHPSLNVPSTITISPLCYPSPPLPLSLCLARKSSFPPWVHQTPV